MIGVYYSDDDVVIVNADCREFLDADLVDAHCAVTSPPYNAGVAYDVHDDTLSSAAFGELAEAASALMFRAIAAQDGRAWVVPGGENFSLWLSSLSEVGFGFANVVCWDCGAPTRACSWGSWKSPGAPHLR